MIKTTGQFKESFDVLNELSIKLNSKLSKIKIQEYHTVDEYRIDIMKCYSDFIDSIDDDYLIFNKYGDNNQVYFFGKLKIVLLDFLYSNDIGI